MFQKFCILFCNKVKLLEMKLFNILFFLGGGGCLFLLIYDPL